MFSTLLWLSLMLRIFCYLQRVAFWTTSIPTGLFSFVTDLEVPSTVPWPGTPQRMFFTLEIRALYTAARILFLHWTPRVKYNKHTEHFYVTQQWLLGHEGQKVSDQKNQENIPFISSLRLLRNLSFTSIRRKIYVFFSPSFYFYFLLFWWRPGNNSLVGVAIHVLVLAVIDSRRVDSQQHLNLCFCGDSRKPVKNIAPFHPRLKLNKDIFTINKQFSLSTIVSKHWLHCSLHRCFMICWVVPIYFPSISTLHHISSFFFNIAGASVTERVVES